MSSVFSPSAYRGQLSFLREEEEKPETRLDVTFGDTSAGNQAGVIAQGDVESLNVRGGNGMQFLEIHGEVDGGYVDLGGGNDQITALAGSVVDGVDFHLGDGDDRFRQEFGSAFDGVGVHGDDGGDNLYFAGHNEGTRIRPGRNEERPDVIALQDTVTGTLDFDDPENWTVKPKDETEWGKDVLQLVGDWQGRDGKRYNTNLFGGGGETAYGGFQRTEGGRVMADLDIIGDKTQLEYVSRVNEYGEEIGTLQSIEPEYEFENMWAKYTGQALVVLGTVIPGAQFLIPVGLGFQTAFEVDNKIASFESTGLNLIQGAANASGVGWLSQGVGVGVSAYRGDYGNAAIGAAGFMPQGSVLQKGLQVGGTGYNAYRAAEQGNVGGAVVTAATIPGQIGWDSSGWIARGGSIAGNSYNFGAAVAEGDVDGALNYGSKLPYGLGIDDDRTIMAIGDYTRTAYRAGTFEFGQHGNDVVTDLLDLAAGPNSMTPGIVDLIDRGNENLAYQAPPDVRVDEEGRLVFENPEERQEYHDYATRFLDENGELDQAALQRAVKDSNLSEPEKELLVGRLVTVLFSEPMGGSIDPKDLRKGTVVVRARDSVLGGAFVGGAVKAKDAEAVAERFRQQGFEDIELIEAAEESPAPAPPEIPEGHVIIAIRDPRTGEVGSGSVPQEQVGQAVEKLQRQGFETQVVDPATLRTGGGNGEPSTAEDGGTSPPADGGAQGTLKPLTPEDAASSAETYEDIGSGSFQTGETGTVDGEIATGGTEDSGDAEALEPILPPDFHREESGGEVRTVPTDEEYLQVYFDEVIERHTSEGMFDPEAFESELRDSGLDPYEQFTVLHLLGERFETDPNAPDVLQPPLKSNSIDRPAGWAPPYEPESSLEPDAGDAAPTEPGGGAFGTAGEGGGSGFSGTGELSIDTSSNIRLDNVSDDADGNAATDVPPAAFDTPDDDEAGAIDGESVTGDVEETPDETGSESFTVPDFHHEESGGRIRKVPADPDYFRTYLDEAVDWYTIDGEGFDLAGFRQELRESGLDEHEQFTVLYLLGERFETDPDAPDVLHSPAGSDPIDQPAGWVPPYDEPAPEDVTSPAREGGAFATGEGEFSFPSDVRFGDAPDGGVGTNGGADGNTDVDAAVDVAVGTEGTTDDLSPPPDFFSPAGSPDMKGDYLRRLVDGYLSEDGLDVYALEQELDRLDVPESQRKEIAAELHWHLEDRARLGEGDYPDIITAPPEERSTFEEVDQGVGEVLFEDDLHRAPVTDHYPITGYSVRSSYSGDEPFAHEVNGYHELVDPLYMEDHVVGVRNDAGQIVSYTVTDRITRELENPYDTVERLVRNGTDPDDIFLIDVKDLDRAD